MCQRMDRGGKVLEDSRPDLWENILEVIQSGAAGCFAYDIPVVACAGKLDNPVSSWFYPVPWSLIRFNPSMRFIHRSYAPPSEEYHAFAQQARWEMSLEEVIRDILAPRPAEVQSYNSNPATACECTTARSALRSFAYSPDFGASSLLPSTGPELSTTAQRAVQLPLPIIALAPLTPRQLSSVACLTSSPPCVTEQLFVQVPGGQS